MKKHALIAIIACAIGLLVAALTLPGRSTAQPQPTLILSPSSGPCDAPVQVSGSGFPVPSGPFSYVALYLVQPGTADVNADSLSAAPIEADGTFDGWAGLRQEGCDAAALDSAAQEPSGGLMIAATLSLATLQPGDHIPDIVATGRYEYTTTARRVPTEALTISPTTGPCDATVDVAGSGFQAALAVALVLASASGEFGLGPLASAVAGSDGRFRVQFSFGGLGCSIAELVGQYSSARELVVGAFPAVRPEPTPPGPPDPLAVVRYTFTTTTPVTAPIPRALPETGAGPGRQSPPVQWFPFVGGLAALGITLIAVSLHGRRVHH